MKNVLFFIKKIKRLKLFIFIGKLFTYKKYDSNMLYFHSDNYQLLDEVNDSNSNLNSNVNSNSNSNVSSYHNFQVVFETTGA